MHRMTALSCSHPVLWASITAPSLENFGKDLGRHWVAEVVPILIDSLRLQSVPAAIDPSNSLFPANPAFFVVDA